MDNEIIEMTACENFILCLPQKLLQIVTMADPKNFSDTIHIALQEESFKANYALVQGNAVGQQKNDKMTKVIGLLGDLLRTIM